MTTSLVICLLLIFGGFGGSARACGGGCRHGRFTHAEFVPNITYYAPYPYWFPAYLGPHYSDYQVIHYVTPPAASALIVKERIAATDAANPALLPPAKEALPLPKVDDPK